MATGVATMSTGVATMSTGVATVSTGGAVTYRCLICVLLLIAVVALRFTARYPKGLYDFVIGINRWAIRVRAYTSLMRDEYPPFRLDMGPRETEPPAAPESA